MGITDFRIETSWHNWAVVAALMAVLLVCVQVGTVESLASSPPASSAPLPAEDQWALAEQRGEIYADCARCARQLLHGWIDLKRDPETHLYTRDRQWDYHNEAADHYSSLVFIAHYIEPSLLENDGTLHQTLINSIRICATPSGIPASYNFKTKELGQPDANRITEWLRDGLIRISGVLGRTMTGTGKWFG